VGITFLLLVFLGAQAGDALGGKFLWEPAGYGGGGRFTAIAADPVNPRRIYVGSDVAGIFRSEDGGETFTLAGRGLSGFAVADIMVNPHPPHEVLTLTDGGLYISRDGGQNWSLLHNLRYSSRFFGSRLLLFTRHHLWVATDRQGIFRLPVTNLRETPLEVPGLAKVKINGLAVFDGYLHAATSRGVYRLAEGHWQLLAAGLPAGTGEMIDIAAGGDRLWVLEQKAGLFSLEKTSSRWQASGLSRQFRVPSYKSLLVAFHDPRLVLVASHPEHWPQRLFRSQDAGANWEMIESFHLDPAGPPNWASGLTGVEEMIFAGTDGRTMWLTDWWNLWHSRDWGRTWHQRHRGLQNTCINDIKTHPRNPDLIYLAAADNGLMISENRGRTWRRAMKGVADGHAREVEICPQNPSRLVLLMTPWHKKGRVYVYESRDAGATWRDIGFSLPPATLPPLGYVDGLPTNLALDPQNEAVIYVGTNGLGVYKTIDGGRNWLPANRGLATPYLKGPGALQVHPQNPRLLYAATQGGLYRSTDGAASWRKITPGDLFTFGMALDPHRPDRILAGAAENKLLLSSDAGATWRVISLPAREPAVTALNAIAFHPRRPGVVLAGTLRYDIQAIDGIFVSEDGGESFREIPLEPPRVNVNVIEADPAAPLAFLIGFNGTGLFRVRWGD
jgi:photosystem II stability/assembly factor-like uncharacterized protein